MADSFPEVFDELKKLFRKQAPKLFAKVDKPDNYYLESKTPTFRDRPMYFGGVRIGKSYVSFYLMSVYGSTVSPELNKRRQGKACFNFKKVEPELFAELQKLVDAGYKDFKQRKWL